jgi:hypothetical protein
MLLSDGSSAKTTNGRNGLALVTLSGWSHNHCAHAC